MALATTVLGFHDPADITTILLDDSRKFSFVQQLGQRVPMTIAGGRYLNVDDITGGFVETEGGRKPVHDPTTTKGTIAVREWAVVVPLSKRLYQYDRDGVVEAIRRKIPEALARDFDRLATTGAGVAGQSNLSQVTNTVQLTSGSVWQDLNEGLRILAQSRKRLTGTALDWVIEPAFNLEVDANDRPLFVDSPVGPETNDVARTGRLLGRRATFVTDLATGSGATQVVGYMGDWSRLAYGLVGGMEFTVSTEGTYVDDADVTHSAIQENLILFRAEALLGVQVADADAFVKLEAGDTNPVS
jgi:HK97 family phage major capsid protein